MNEALSTVWKWLCSNDIVLVIVSVVLTLFVEWLYKSIRRVVGRTLRPFKKIRRIKKTLDPTEII